MTGEPPKTPGALWHKSGQCLFSVWAPRARSVNLRLFGDETEREREIALDRGADGIHWAAVESVKPETRYLYRLSGTIDGAIDRPDPASRFQPEGVHGPSAVVDLAFDWSDRGWNGPPMWRYVMYELHVGTFTSAGTFDAAIEHLASLRELGVTAVEVMPVGQFPGSRNWGYDGVDLYAVQASYGGPKAFQRFVDACHREGLAVVLDVVYNHLGPEGNYLADFAPYFTDRYRTPWGPALNFDGPGSDLVRHFFIENACFFVRDFHVDALRLDAVHAIVDCSAFTFLEELTRAVHVTGEALGRRALVIAESDLNDTRLVRPKVEGGYGIDAQWSDDFHHALHALLTGERNGYYRDFGRLEDLARAFSEGYVFSGQYSRFRDRRHGNSTRGVEGSRFVVCAQNHDQVGNRMRGERLTRLVDLEQLKIAAGAVLLAPFVPLLFMGEEWGETAPFPYFVSHGDRELLEEVRRGRERESVEFGWRGEAPDPVSDETFNSARLDRRRAEEAPGRALRLFYRELLRIRRQTPALAEPRREGTRVSLDEEHSLLTLARSCGDSRAVVLFHFGAGDAPAHCDLDPGRWIRAFDSGDRLWAGPGCRAPRLLAAGAPDVAISLGPWNFVLLIREGEPA
jgi:maltooligosyltrehalose trehalohydrolase